MRFIPLSLITLVSLSAFAFAPARAGEAEDSVNKFFLDYQSRVRAAKDMTELTPYLSKKTASSRLLMTEPSCHQPSLR